MDVLTKIIHGHHGSKKMNESSLVDFTKPAYEKKEKDEKPK